MYPIALLNNPPRPIYPEYDAVEALARQLTPQFVDPANLWPEREVVGRRGNDWCTAVLGRPYVRTTRISVHEQYLLIAADRLGVDPPLPDWIVLGRVEGARVEQEREAAQRARRLKDVQAWSAALAAATVELDVYASTSARTRYGTAHHLGHAVPRSDVYSGTRKVRTHRRGRPLCETATRGRQLDVGDEPAPAGMPATCVRCLEWTPKVRGADPATHH